MVFGSSSDKYPLEISQYLGKNLHYHLQVDSELSALSCCLTHFISLKVQGHIKNLIEEHFKDSLEQAMRDPILFGDFRMALNEEEPRIYEDIQDYDAAKALFQVVCSSLALCLILSLCLRNGQEPALSCGKPVHFLRAHSILCVLLPIRGLQ